MPLPTTLDDARRLATELHSAAVRGADAGLATARAVERAAPWTGRVQILAIGKAAPAMGRAAVLALREAGHDPVGGLVVGAEPSTSEADGLEHAAGDHPVPGTRSAAAAERVGALAGRVEEGEIVLVLLSGGATSLVAAPVPGVDAAELAPLFDRLLASGADIAAMNAVRKRFLRWGGGRLAAALAPAGVRCLAVSDVAGDDPAVIGSGPCVPDPTTAAELLAAADRAPLAGTLSPALRAHLAAVARGRLPETPKPGDAAFVRVRSEILLSNRDALRAAAEEAARRGLPVTVAPRALAGPAVAAGERCAAELVARTTPGVVLWGGETTVALGDAPPGLGGRCQELALAAARRLHAARAEGIVLLAAGTDGRDGPTDAAGAVVDHTTWERCRAAGVDPAAALDRHDAHRALAAAGALLRTGPTGTNVRDVVIGIARR